MKNEMRSEITFILFYLTDDNGRGCGVVRYVHSPFSDLIQCCFTTTETMDSVLLYVHRNHGFNVALRQQGPWIQCCFTATETMDSMLLYVNRDRGFNVALRPQKPWIRYCFTSTENMDSMLLYGHRDHGFNVALRPQKP